MTDHAQTLGNPLAATMLQAENQRLRQQLDTLLNEARLNQEKLRRFDMLEQKLIATQSLCELFRVLLHDYRQTFDLDAVTLALVDPQYEVAHILDQHNASAEQRAGLVLLDKPRLLHLLYGVEPCPLLEPFDMANHGPLGLAETAGLASVALLPLRRPGALIGSLNLGSRQRERFAAGNSTDFLARLAAIVAVCLDSALNQERLKLLGLTDPLTGVHNRRYFEARCLEEVTLARRRDWPLACMFLDVDKFKSLNDTLGHQMGDEVLRQIAQVIKQQLRASDVMARYGGEEFVTLLPNTALGAASDTAERIRRAVAEHDFGLPPERPGMTISIGLSMLEAAPGKGSGQEQADRMVHAADLAVYRAKEGGRNQVEIAAAASV